MTAILTFRGVVLDGRRGVESRERVKGGEAQSSIFPALLGCCPCSSAIASLFWNTTTTLPDWIDRQDNHHITSHFTDNLDS